MSQVRVDSHSDSQADGLTATSVNDSGPGTLISNVERTILDISGQRDSDFKSAAKITALITIT